MSRTEPPETIASVLRVLATALGLAYVAAYLFVALARMGYPFELEWMEGGAVDHVRRVLAGERLYVAPSLDFVPYTYTPLYFYISAALSRLTGAGFLPLRLVSFVSSVGSLVLIARIVRRRVGGWIPAVLAASLFAATFRAAGAWFDIARVDSLFLFLLLAAVAVLERWAPGFSEEVVAGGAPPAGRAVPEGIAAGLLIALAFFTKQAALVIGIPIVLAAVALNRRMGIACATIAAAVIGGGILILDRASGGWFNFYVFDIPRLHVVVRSMLLDFWTLDLGRRVLVGCVLAGFLLGSRALERRARIYFALLAAGMIGGTYAVRIQDATYDNVLLPAYAAIALLAGLATPAAARRGRGLLVYGAWIAQFALLVYNPAAQIPTAADERAGRALVSRIAQVPGPVFVPCHGYLAEMAGKPPHAQMMALGDALRCRRSDVRDRLNAEVAQSLAEHRFAMIVEDGDWFPGMERFYASVGPVFTSPTVFWPRTGLRTRPERILIPRSRAAS